MRSRPRRRFEYCNYSVLFLFFFILRITEAYWLQISFIMAERDSLCSAQHWLWHNPVLYALHILYRDISRSRLLYIRLLWPNETLPVLHTVYCGITRSCLFYFAISAYDTITSCTYIFTTVLVSIFYRNRW